MAQQKTSRLWSYLVGVVVAGTVLSIIGSSSVQAVVRACCFANGTCEDLSRSECEDQRGGVAQTAGEFCNMVNCPLLCGGSFPECNGDCPAPTTCVQTQMDHTGRSVRKLTVSLVCECVPEIPPGGACEQQPDACAGGLPCEDGVCCATVCSAGERCDLPGSEGVCAPVTASAPALSTIGLTLLVAVLLATGGWTLVRRRRLG